jgi:adenylate kinase
MNDPTRVRDSDDVAEHDSINRAYLAAYSAFTGAPAVIIYNKQGKVEEAVAKLEKIF